MRDTRQGPMNSALLRLAMMIERSNQIPTLFSRNVTAAARMTANTIDSRCLTTGNASSGRNRGAMASYLAKAYGYG